MISDFINETSPTHTHTHTHRHTHIPGSRNFNRNIGEALPNHSSHWRVSYTTLFLSKEEFFHHSPLGNTWQLMSLWTTVTDESVSEWKYINYHRLKKTENKIALFFPNTHTRTHTHVLFHWLLHHSSISDTLPLKKDHRSQEIFFCSQSNHVLYYMASPIFLPLLFYAAPYLWGSSVSTGLLCGFCWALQPPPWRTTSSL